MRITAFHPYMFGRGGGERHASRVCHHLANAHDLTVYGLWGKEGIGAPDWWKGLHIKKAWEHVKTPVLRRTLNGMITLFKKPPLEPESDLFIGFGPHGVVLAGRLSASLPTIGYFFHPWYVLYHRSIDRDASVVGRLIFRNYFFTPFLKAVDRGQVVKVRAVGANSPHIADLVRKYYGVNCRVMTPGVDPRLLPPKRDMGYGDYIYLPTRIVHHKNVHTAIKALHLLRTRYDRDVDLVISGPLIETGYQRYLQKLIQDLDLLRHVHFTGFVSESDLWSLYRNALCHWFTPLMEDFGLTPLESMMMRTPVIAANDGGALYTVIDGVTGFHVDPLDAVAFASRTALLMDDAETRAEMGIAAREHVLENFTWAEHFEAWDQLMEDVI